MLPKQEIQFPQTLHPPMEKKLVPDRFQLKKKLGQGTFSVIFEAWDSKRKENVALKIEKKDKIKTILLFEFKVLNNLQHNEHICKVYEYVENNESKQNFISMELLGLNLAKVKRNCKEGRLSRPFATHLLIQMLDAIEETHRSGFIHRDIKASNFVLSKNGTKVYLVDFGLAKKHIGKDGKPIPARRKADFRGTVSFASLNAHYCIDLSRRDDLWSWYFVLLDFYNEPLKWRENKNLSMNQVKEIKEACIKDAENKLWSHETEDLIEIREIWDSIKKLQYADEPDYSFIRGKLKQIYERTQCMYRYNTHNYDNFEEKESIRPIQMQTTHVPTFSELGMEMYRPYNYIKENNKNCLQYHLPEYENRYNLMKNYNTLNTNYSIGIPSSLHPQMSATSMQKPQMQEYNQREPTSNINLSLNQILSLPYQIVMPPSDNNQSISINNLPSLNDLAIRTGINTGMSTIFASQRQMQAPSPVPITTPQFILPLSSFYSTNCTKDHLQLPIPILETHQAKPPNQYYKQMSTPTIPSLRQSNLLRDNNMLNSAYCYSSMNSKPVVDQEQIPNELHLFSLYQNSNPDMRFKQLP